LGLGGVGDTKGMLESIMRDRDIKWVTNAKVDRINADTLEATELNEDGSVKKTHKIPTKFTMMLPAFRGVDCLKDENGKWIEGLTNPRGFVTVDRKQRNAKYPNVFAVGVYVALPPFEPTPVPVGTPKTGYMIESMCTAAAHSRSHRRQGADARGNVEFGVPCRLRRQRHRFRRAAADPAAQCELVEQGLLGASRQGRLSNLLPAQGTQGTGGALL
jgi:sulfide:quinone oxidoreductase